MERGKGGEVTYQFRKVQMKYSIIIEKGRESGYVAFCPTLRGCVSQGATEREAIQNLKKAVKDYIDCLLKDGLPVPTQN